MNVEIFLLIIPIYLGMGMLWYKIGKLEGLLNGKL